jgi:hypothetical protein
MLLVYLRKLSVGSSEVIQAFFGGYQAFPIQALLQNRAQGAAAMGGGTARVARAGKKMYASHPRHDAMGLAQP